MRSSWIRIGAALLTTCAMAIACAGHHIAAGDSAAATGDWERAETEYRNALARKPNEPGLKEKHDHAKVEAMKQAKARVQSCLQERNFPCAVDQAEYAAALEPTDGEASSLRVQAHKAQALDTIARANSVAPSDATQAFPLLDQARGQSNDAEVSSALAAATANTVNAAISQAGAIEAKATQPGTPGAIALFDKAIYLLQWAARSDPRQAAAVEALKGRKQRWIDGEYERLARIGDDSASRRDFRNAAAQYQQAEAFRPGGRARGLAAWSAACGQGDAAFAAHDYAGAINAFRAAASMPEDRGSGYAAGQVVAVNRATEAEYERLAHIGDDSLKRRDWKAATAQYQAAENFRPGGRAKGLLAYATACGNGDAAFSAKNWLAAGTAYRAAAAMPEDRGMGYAQAQLDNMARAIEEEYHRLIGAGDDLRLRHDWAGATAQYKSADALRPGGPAPGRIEYDDVVIAGDQAIVRRDWKAASESYRRAASWPEDKLEHYAASQADKCEMKSWKIRYKSALLRPLKADESPWVGHPSVALADATRELSRGGPHDVNWKAISRVPTENVPSLILEVTLPDGRTFDSAPRQGVSPDLDASVIVQSNAFDDRVVVSRILVVQPGGAPLEADEFHTPIRDLLATKPPLSAPEVLALDFAVEDGRGQPEGTVISLTAVASQTPPAPIPMATMTPPPPTPVTTHTGAHH